MLLMLSASITDRYKERELKSNLLLNTLSLLSMDIAISVQRYDEMEEMGTIIKKYDNAFLEIQPNPPLFS